MVGKATENVAVVLGTGYVVMGGEIGQNTRLGARPTRALGGNAFCLPSPIGALEVWEPLIKSFLWSEGVSLSLLHR